MLGWAAFLRVPMDKWALMTLELQPWITRPLRCRLTAVRRLLEVSVHTSSTPTWETLLLKKAAAWKVKCYTAHFFVTSWFIRLLVQLSDVSRSCFVCRGSNVVERFATAQVLVLVSTTVVRGDAGRHWRVARTPGTWRCSFSPIPCEHCLKLTLTVVERNERRTTQDCIDDHEAEGAPDSLARFGKGIIF